MNTQVYVKNRVQKDAAYISGKQFLLSDLCIDTFESPTSINEDQINMCTCLDSNHTLDNIKAIVQSNGAPYTQKLVLISRNHVSICNSVVILVVLTNHANLIDKHRLK